MHPLKAISLGTSIVISHIQLDRTLNSRSTVVHSIAITNRADPLEEAWTKIIAGLSPTETTQATLLEKVHSVFEKFVANRYQWRDK